MFVLVCADNINFDGRLNMLDRTRVARLYFITLPIAAFIPIIIYWLIKLMFRDKNLLRENNTFNSSIFIPFPFDEISISGIMDILLDSHYTDVVDKLYEHKLLNEKWKNGLLKTYEQFPTISFKTPTEVNPFTGITNIECSFCNYKLDIITIYLSESNKNKDKYEELSILFTRIFKNEPSFLNSSLYWKNSYSTISLNKTLGTITIQLTN